MRPTVMPGTGRPAGAAGVVWACVLGGLAGLFHARGAHVWMAVALGAALGIALALRTGGLADWGAVVCGAVVIAICARFYAGWALSRNESLWQRCSFVLAVLAAGARLWITGVAAPAASEDASEQCEPLRASQVEQGPPDRPAGDDARGIAHDDAEEVKQADAPRDSPVIEVEDAGETAECPAPGRRRILLLW